MKIDDLRRCLALVEEAAGLYKPPLNPKEQSLEGDFRDLRAALYRGLQAAEFGALDKLKTEAGRCT